MAHNEITMDMDVKMDLKEKKFEYYQLRVNLERHINWVQNSVINLEILRREMLEMRRASRISRIDDSVVRSLNTSVDCDAGKCNDTQDIRDINDILGPLPKLPDSNVNWSRRISTTSEIYEEIGDHRNTNRKSSRASIASGIYEVMTSPMIDENARILEEMPPPLPPPRPRVNNQTEINRAYTNPESISSKKRKRNIFETVFSRHKSMQKRKTSNPKEQTPTKAESPMIELIRSHRMSYSSPDLSKADVVEVNHYINEFEGDLMARSSATEFSVRNEYSFLNSTTSSDEKELFGDERNISENILSTYNISCNESTVNLVGANLNQEKKSVATIIDDVSGYCQMAPIIRTASTTSPVSAPELSPTFPFFPDDLSHRRIPVDVTKAITFCRDYGMEASLQNFENLTISKEHSQKSSNDSKNISSSSPSDQVKSKKSTGSPVPSKHNNSFDEKYPSYYPNEVPKTPSKEHVQKTPHKEHRKKDGIDYLSQSSPITPPRAENLYIATPRHGSNRSIKRAKDQTKSTVLSPTNSVVSSSASELLTPPMKPSISETISSASSLLYHHKYATVTPFKDSGSCKKSNDISSLKRFSSLPRFKKIDFSPLKLKINSVLQRQNHDQI